VSHNERCLCNGCGRVLLISDLLRAASPFKPDEQVLGCPRCRQHMEGFKRLCNVPMCHEDIGRRGLGPIDERGWMCDTHSGEWIDGKRTIDGEWIGGEGAR